MKREAEFTPEFGLFVFIVAVGFMIFIGLVYTLLIRAKGMQITSWWRSFAHNAEVGGVKNSLHLIGFAWDVVPVNDENKSALQNLGLTVIDEGDHLHAAII